MHDHQDGGCGCGCGHHGPQEMIDLGIDWAAAPDEEIVCACKGVTKAQILEAIATGAYTQALIAVMTQAGRGSERECRAKNPRGRHCAADIEELVRLYANGPEIANRTGCS